MKRFVLALSLLLAGSAFAEGDAPPPVPAQKPASPTSFVAQGEAIEIPEAGFTIVPPVGWEVTRNASGASLLFQTPKVEGAPGVVTYQSNIRIMVMNEPRPMDLDTKDDIGKIIVEKYGSIAGVMNYNIRSADKVSLQDGSEAFLYYTEFSLSNTPMMQMHIFISSATKHFLMTYTDLATVFETENSPGLTTAFTSLHSAKVDSKPAERFAQYYVVGGCILALLVLLVIIRVVRGFSMKRLGERIESEDAGESSRDDDDDDTPVSDIADFKSSMDNHNDDDEEMPETREAKRPAPKEKRAEPVHAPVPPPAAKAPAAKAPAAPAPAKPAAPKAPVAPQIATPSLPEETQDASSDVSEFKPKTVVTTKKAKPQKVANPAKMKDIKDEEPENSEVARISEILPNTGDTKKKKGFFSWGKGKSEYDQDLEAKETKGHIGDEDSWDEESKTAAKSTRKQKKGKADEQPVSEVAGWNLNDGGAKSRFDDDEDE